MIRLSAGPALLTALALAPAACRVAPEPVVAGSGEPRVVVLVLDGARVDETTGEGTTDITDQATSSIMPRSRSELWSHSTVYSAALQTGVPITTEGHTSLITGLRQPLATFPPAADTDWYRSDTFTLFEAARAQIGLEVDQVALIGNTILLSDLRRSAHPAGGLGPSYSHLADVSDSNVVIAVKQQLEARDTRLVVANLHQIDLAGHNEPSPAYVERITEADGPIADLWAWIEDTEPYSGHTTLILVADHGRHRWAPDEQGEAGSEREEWREHGDQCTGCRQIPLVIVGPETVVDADTPVTLEDLGATIADLLEVDLPHTTGRSLVSARAAAGAFRVAADGAVEVLAQGRSTVWRGASPLSDSDLAEAPVSAGGLLCWRALWLDTSPAEMPWQPVCIDENGQDASPPRDRVSPYWRPALVAEDGTVWMADTTGDWGYTGAADVHPRLSRWTDGTWDTSESGTPATETSPPELSLPLAPALAVDGDRAWVALASSQDESRGRDTRSVGLWQVDWPMDGEQEWTSVLTWSPGTGEAERLERPALVRQGDRLLLAALTYGPDGVDLIAASGSAGSWTDPVSMDGSGRVLALPGAVWTPGGELLWLRLDPAGGIEVCVAELAEAARCEAIEADAAADLVSTDAGVRASLRSAGESTAGVWTAEVWTAEVWTARGLP